MIVGRDQKTRQLCIIKDGASRLYGNAGSVPMDVSRHQISLQPVGQGKWLIKNLSEQNVTFVNGLAIESKSISSDDKVELGNSHYLLNWDALKEPEVETVDIRPLSSVWYDYNRRNMYIRNRQKNIGLLSSIPIGITMFGGLVAGLGPDAIKPFAYFFTAIALLVMLIGFYLRFSDNAVEEQERVRKDFQKKYVCPKCGHFMGFQDYDILIQNDGCPYCKTKYKK